MSEREELWLEIEDAPGYAVSDMGRVQNSRTGRILSLSRTSRGGNKVGLVVDGEQVPKIVKNLVAEHFVPGRTDIFDTAIHMDGNPYNDDASNLVWRPRWFALKYARQFKDAYANAGRGPIRNIERDVLYENVYDASVANGLLFRDVFSSCLDGEPVFPDWETFEWLH